MVWFMTLESSAPLSLETVTNGARKECAVYCWAIRLIYFVVIRRVVR